MKSLSFYFAVACSIVSQVFIALEIGNSDLLKLSWFIPFVFYLLSNAKLFLDRILIPYYIFVLIFVFYCLCCEAVTNVSYIGADTYNICISIFILSISYCYGMHIQSFKRSFNNLSFFFFVASLVYGISVYVKYLVGADMFSMVYAYGDKNSAAQIFLSACIILFTLFRPSNFAQKIVAYSLIVILLYVMFILKSRATLLGFFFVLGYFTFVYKNKKVRYVFFLAIIAMCIYILSNPSFYRTLVEGILFANRDSSDLNSLSSGRVEQLETCVDLFVSSPIIGIGNKYFDCFPIIILTQYGIMGAIIVFVFIGNRMKECLYKLDTNKQLDLCAFLLMMTYMLDSLFEAQPPFGPGAKCFPLWMIWGIMLSTKVKRYRDNNG